VRHFLDKTQLKKEQLEFSVLGILIGPRIEELKQFSDRLWVVKDLIEDTVIQELFCSKLEYFRQSFVVPKSSPPRKHLSERRSREFLYLPEIDALIAATQETRSPSATSSYCSAKPCNQLSCAGYVGAI